MRVVGVKAQLSLPMAFICGFSISSDITETSKIMPELMHSPVPSSTHSIKISVREQLSMRLLPLRIIAASSSGSASSYGRSSRSAISTSERMNSRTAAPCET